MTTFAKIARAGAALALAFAAAAALAQEALQESSEDAPAAPYVEAWLDAVAGDAAPQMMAGDAALLSARLVNGGDAPLRVRRVIVSAAASIRFDSPLADAIDNDSDGQVDAGPETLMAVEAENTLIWKLSGPEAAGHPETIVAPGEAITWRALAKLGAAAAATPGVSITFIASTRNNGRLELVRLTAAAEVRPATPLQAYWRVYGPPAERGETPIFTHGDAARWRLFADLPAGLTPNLTLTLTPPAAAPDAAVSAYEIGDGLACRDAVEPIAVPASDGAPARLLWLLGDCVGDPTDDADRRIMAEVQAEIADVDAFANPLAMAAHRFGRLSADIAYGTKSQATEGLWTPVRLSGPLLRVSPVEAAEPPPETFRAGDFVRARFTLRNMGDRTARDLTAWAEPHPALNCRFLRMDFLGRVSAVVPDEAVPDEHCGQVVSLGAAAPLAAGEAVDIEVSAPISSIAPLDQPLSLALRASANDLGDLRARADGVGLEVAPEPPALARLSPLEGWGEEAPGLSPGSRARMRLDVTLPPGVSTLMGELRLRLVNPRTGAPLGPADVGLVGVTLIDAESRLSFESAALGEAELDFSDGWRVVRFPIGVASYEASGLERQIQASFAIGVEAQDSPALRNGRALQIAAALLTPTARIEAEEVIEAAIREPFLELAAKTSDEDRLISPGDRPRFSAEACNAGDAPAYAVALRAEIAPPLLTAPPAGARISLGRRNRSAAGREAGEATYDAASGVLTARLDPETALPPGECMRLTFTTLAPGRLEPDSVLATAFVIEPFRNQPEASGRLYKFDQPIRVTLRAPALRFGPPARGFASPGREIAYEAVLRAPAIGGPFVATMDYESTAGLDWRLYVIDSDGRRSLWRDGMPMADGETARIFGSAAAPRPLPVDWADTTVLRATALSRQAGMTRNATLSWITTANDDLSVQIRTDKVMALDRNCNGAVEDESAQDALFESYKEARVGECVVFRVNFANVGDSSMEEISIRDLPPAGTDYVPASQQVAREPGRTNDTRLSESEDGALIWRFIGAYDPGAEGAVEYHVAITDR